MLRCTRLVLPLLIVLLTALPAAAEGPLTNQDVLDLVSLGLGDEVVIAKIEQAPSTAFALETADLAGLKKGGASSAVIAAMLKKATPRATPPGTAQSTTPEVTLQTRSGTTALVGMTGTQRYENRIMAIVSYLDILGTESIPEITDTRPSFVVRTDVNPNGTYYLAHARPYPRKDVREIKTGTMSMMGSGSTTRPHEAWTVPCDVEQVSIGLWRLTPQEPLQGREYVLWKTYGATPGTYLPYVFDFRVEHDSMWTEP